MAERKADRHPVISNAYHIPVDAEQLSRFPHQGHVAIVLSEAHSGYECFQKDIPGHLVGKTHKEKSIKWLNNFGLKPSGKKDYADEVPEYTILLENFKDAQYVYYDGKEILPLKTSPYKADPTKVSAVLHLGDPAIGWSG
jgi:hypothetical protein